MKRSAIVLLVFATAAVGLAVSSGSADMDKKTPANANRALSVNPADIKALVQGNNEFAFDLYKQLSKKEGNVFFSPYSISTALAMVYSGARGKTAEEMAKVLHFTLPQERLHPALDALNEDLQKAAKDGRYQLRIANALWVQSGRTFVPGFTEMLERHYQTGLREVDFCTDPGSRLAEINKWVEEQTDNQIHNLILPGEVDAMTDFMVANAIYFKSGWAKAFDSKETADADFHITSDRKITVPMMHGGVNGSYFRGDGVQILSLPYENTNLRMLVILPDTCEGLNAAEKALAGGKLNEWITRLGPCWANTRLPQFRLTNAYRLRDQLAEMGMLLPFRAEADFSGMTKERFALGSVAHKAYIDVNEAGTEAAAATTIVRPVPISDTPPPLIVTFTADRPFLFVVRETLKGTVLFVGRVSRPAQN